MMMDVRVCLEPNNLTFEAYQMGWRSATGATTTTPPWQSSPSLIIASASSASTQFQFLHSIPGDDGRQPLISDSDLPLYRTAIGADPLDDASQLVPTANRHQQRGPGAPESASRSFPAPPAYGSTSASGTR